MIRHPEYYGRRPWSITTILALGLLCSLLAACGGGGDSDSSNQTSADVSLARQLSATSLSKNPEIIPVSYPVDEPALLFQKDQQLIQAAGSAVLANRYAETLSELARRAQISRVNVAVVSDLACTAVPFGGGVAGDSVLFLDGKLLDLMADIANGLALQEFGRINATTAQIVDAVASQQLSFSRACLATDPIAFADSHLTSQELNRSIEIFTQLTGGIFYHEYGHVWGWHTLIGIRDRIIYPGGGFFSYTSALEDRADLTSGILNAKAGHDATFPKLMYDFMTFTYFYRRAPGSLSFGDVQTWQAQYQQTSPTYSSTGIRKSLIDAGYSAWQRK